MKLNIGFVGMTHLGIISSIASASKKFNTVAFDEDYKLINQIKKKRFPINEPKLIATYNKVKEYLNFSNNPDDLRKCDLVYFSIDVPTNNNGKSDLKLIKKKINNTLKYLNKKSTFVILCQVSPGFTKKINWPKNRKFYQVETLVFGNAIERALKPERIIIGCNDKLCKKLNFFLKSFECPILCMNYESAELTKISINICLVSNITVANTLAEICEKIGANWNEIIPALKMDRRIGKYSYLKPGLGIAGGNLERDLNNIKKISSKNKTHSKIIDAIQSNSEHCSQWVYKKLEELNIKRISIWGVTYKENTHSIKNSPSIKSIKLMSKYVINLYDPVVNINKLNLKTSNFTDKYESLKKSEVLAIFSPWEEFRQINIKKFKKYFCGKFILDPYNTFQNLNLGKKIKILTIGNGII